MRIEAPELEISSGASVGAANARRTWTGRRGLLLRLRSGSKIGLGEASPLPNYSPDTLAEARQALELWRPREVEPSLDGIRRALETIPATIPSARFAAEVALLDLLGQQLAKPLYLLLLGQRQPELAPAFRTPEVANAALLPLDLNDLEPARIELAKLLGRGYRHFKVKIGRPGRFDDELRALHDLRRAGGDSWRLRLDANGLLAPEKIGQRLAALAELKPEFIEQPVSWPALSDLTSSPVPLGVDESLRLGWQTLEPWLQKRVCRFVILKPAILGGLLPCLELAEQARRLNLAPLASHCFDGPVALQATAALAVAIEMRAEKAQAAPQAHGTALHAGLEAWSYGAGLMVDGARIRYGDALPGLGVTR